MTEHYFSKEPVSSFNLRKVKFIINHMEDEFYTGAGIFSNNKLDFGTRVLIENMKIKEEDDVLDLGCGLGVVGRIVANVTKGKVILVDINKRAVKLSKMNTKGLKNVEVFQGDQYEAVEEKKFDVILLNPPQTAGKKVCLAMIQKAIDHLKKGGSLQMVARHNKGGETLSKYMIEIFGNMETLVREGGYRVYMSIKE